ncbi:hypothetical protein MCOR27_008185 [Pyricularia oryzae]|uniref:Rhodopsin domain-containing protein n=1 Tax=Pyricularia grisea TaxID=148305 RepID=A0ABQ8NXV3_PYRGI|nr:hypothetical protein MCOR01_003604 [Pyricularia oryzae]KAI6303637.1 hypothetical protein MCOR33_001161 [Pyricularia grisea]KAI6255334.1 hypothetical protein MCOR19_008149 [Pyricularia oryzae]KAI6264323.1 hypothetical protein MCOR26_011429 [Pyricularia oryzae]KAI6272771.1 hypothetical protein MCOR27_008185 [Pyricularia oryzae]
MGRISPDPIRGLLLCCCRPHKECVTEHITRGSFSFSATSARSPLSVFIFPTMISKSSKPDFSRPFRSRPPRLPSGFQWVYANALVYTVATLCIKVTLVLLIARVFSIKRHIVWRIYSGIFVFTLYTIAVLLAKVFSCTPFASYWDVTVQPEYCIDRSKMWKIDSTMAVITDLAILVLPASLVMPLRLPLAKKIRISGLLGLGGIAILSSGANLYLILAEGDDSDISGNGALLGILTLMELASGFICACLPPIALVIEKKSHGRRGSSNNPRARLYRRMKSHSGGSSAPVTTLGTATGFTSSQIRRDDLDEHRNPQQQAYTSRADTDVELGTLPATSRWPSGVDLRSPPMTADTTATSDAANRNAALTWADQPMDDQEQSHSPSAGTMQQTTPWPSSRSAASRWRLPQIISNRAPTQSSTSMGGIMRTIQITLETAEAGEPPDDKTSDPGGDRTSGQSNSRVGPPLVAMTRAAAGCRAKSVHARIWDGKSHDLGTRAIGYSE